MPRAGDTRGGGQGRVKSGEAGATETVRRWTGRHLQLMNAGPAGAAAVAVATTAAEAAEPVSDDAEAACPRPWAWACP